VTTARILTADIKTEVVTHLGYGKRENRIRDGYGTSIGSLVRLRPD